MGQADFSVLEVELRTLRSQAERISSEIQEELDRVSAQKEELRKFVEWYEDKWKLLFVEVMRSRGLVWCTCCSKVLPTNEVSLMLFEGNSYDLGGDNTHYSGVHRVCATCRKVALDRHDCESFYAFRVEQRASGNWVRRFGHWKRMKQEIKFRDLLVRVMFRMGEEWNLPPWVMLDKSGCKLIVPGQKSEDGYW